MNENAIYEKHKSTLKRWDWMWSFHQVSDWFRGSNGQKVINQQQVNKYQFIKSGKNQSPSQGRSDE